jgi:hypothetical protein
MRLARSVIHIGANKTGSTTLQRCLFARSEELLYLGEDCDGYDEYAKTLNSLVSDDDLHYMEKEAAGLFRSFRERAGARTLIYSNEDITTSRVPAQCARRLRQLMPDSLVLLVIRNQLTAIPSWYVNHGAYLKHVPRRYWRRYVSFDDWMDHCLRFLNYSPLDGFFYSRILGLYAGLFGRDRIRVLLYEDFLKDEAGFVEALCAILEIDAKASMQLLAGRRERTRKTMREHRYHRFRGWFFPGAGRSADAPGLLAGFLSGGPPANGFLSDAWRARVQELYERDNSELAREYGLPLYRYGYPMLTDSSGGDHA